MKNKAFYSVLSRGLLFALFLFVLLGCSTQKNSWISRNYHSISAKYNGYFNARESYRQGLARLAEQHQDNYDEVLSIYRYGNVAQAGGIKNFMDVAYQKASLVIRRHSMFIRGTEYNRWIDDAYYLIARSHFFNLDYPLAILTFEYIIRQYDSDLAYDSKVWIAKSYNAMGNYDRAQEMLEIVKADLEQGLLSDEGERLFYLTYADHFARQKEYASAIPYLQDGIRATRKNRDRTRLTYILGQHYQYSGDYANAQRTYASVLKMNPTFDMAFQARISMAMAYDPSTGDSGFIRSELNNMLRDEKNDPYQDRIYYALGQLAMREQKEDDAIDHYLKSTQVSEGNNMQKGLSFLRLGEIYYERPDYLKASIYYDSTMTFLPRTFDGIEPISERKVMLSDLALNLRVIEREDSLQRLAALTPAERNAIIDEIITKLREEEQRRRQEESDRMRTYQAMQTQRRMGEPQDNSWYFYNPSAMSFGRTEFVSRFGERPLEDLWRISNKQTIAFGFDGGAEGVAEGDSLGGDEAMDRSSYLRNIPTTPEQMEASNGRIAQAFFNLGVIFKDRFKDLRNAVTNFESLVNRFPENENKLHAYYYLYNLYRDLGDPSRADSYKSRLISEFPESDFAQILGDPNYLQNFRQRQSLANQLYEQTYEAFRTGNYSQVISNWDTADTLEIDLPLRAQFSYLKALAYGKSRQQNEFRQELEYVVRNFEGTPVHQPATDLLASLGTHTLLLPEEEFTEDTGLPEEELVSIYSYNASAVHFFAFVFDVRQVEARELRNFITEFNVENYPDSRLSMSNIFLDDRRQIITVTNFRDKNLGMDYFRKIVSAPGFSIFNADAITSFIISVDNYPIFYQDKDVDEYLRFFRARYTR
ncbi:MAG: tetratricopeptide repeat protein [Bacteroides sp.]|nr:tetratricopeptide repeat protein [Bacteroides sp.]